MCNCCVFFVVGVCVMGVVLCCGVVWGVGVCVCVGDSAHIQHVCMPHMTLQFAQ